jgi:hypothetical protein
MKNKFKIITACTAALVYCAPVAAFAASPTPAASPKSSPAAKTTTSPAAKTSPSPTDKTTTKVRAIPFHGTISTVEHTAKTFTIAGKEKSRIFKVTDSTVITKGGAPATLNEIGPNEEVRGSYVKAADGSLEARTVKVGPMTEAEKAEKPSKKKSKKDEDASSPSPAASPKP